MVSLSQNTIFATATIVGMTIGAGIFGIPYALAQSGIILGILYFVIVGAAVLFIHLFFGEVVLRTEGIHHLPGYAQIYLGTPGRVAASFSTLVGGSGTILAYLVLGGEFLHTMFSPLWDISSFWWTILFWIISFFFVFRGIRFIASLELLMVGVFLLLIIALFLYALPRIDWGDVPLWALNKENIFLPYGVLLFSFAGWVAIPEAASILSQSEKKHLKTAIALAFFIVAAFYFLFATTVVGVNGINTMPDALSGLAERFGDFIYLIGGFFGILVISSSLLVLGDYLKNSLKYDYRVSGFFSALIAATIPLLLFLVGFREFIFAIAFIGVLLGAVEGVIITLIFQKSKKMITKIPEYSISTPRLLPFTLIGVFLAGAMIEAYNFLVR